jgi:hypothetical protein
MRQRARFFVHFGGAIALVVFVLVVAVWAASYRTMSAVVLERDDRAGGANLNRVAYALFASGGVIRFARSTIDLTTTDQGTEATAIRQMIAREMSSRSYRDGWCLSTHAQPTQDLAPQSRHYHWNDLGVAWHGVDRRSFGLERVVQVRCAVIALAPGLLSALWVKHLAGHRRRQRRAAGQCVKCGYDLRASPDRCPECGTTPAAK